MQFPITIGLHRSRFLDLALLFAALVGSGAIAAWPQAIPVRTAVCVALWGVAGMAWRQLSPPLAAIRLERDGRIEIARPGDTEFSAAELLPEATVHPWLTVLRLKTEDGRTYTLIAAVDSLAAQDFRRLRVFLRWQADFSGAGDGA